MYRAVRPEERSLALGIQSIIIRLVGSIPGPVLFGFVVDKVCLLWEPGCGEFSSFAGRCRRRSKRDVVIKLVNMSELWREF
jgi:hypothetical protein